MKIGFEEANEKSAQKLNRQQKDEEKEGWRQLGAEIKSSSEAAKIHSLTQADLPKASRRLFNRKSIYPKALAFAEKKKMKTNKEEKLKRPGGNNGASSTGEMTREIWCVTGKVSILESKNEGDKGKKRTATATTALMAAAVILAYNLMTTTTMARCAACAINTVCKKRNQKSLVALHTVVGWLS